MRAVAVAVAALVAGLAGVASAEVPVTLGFQGYVETGGGEGFGGVTDVTVRLFSGKEAGEALWEEDHPDVGIVDGALSIDLGASAESQELLQEVLIGQQEVWAEFEVEGADAAFPRQRLVAAPYAVAARYSNSADVLLTPASDLACVACVEAAEVSFAFAGAVQQGGAATEALALTCSECVDLPHLAPAVLALLDAIGALSDALDELEQKVSKHSQDPSIHHAKYTDAEAVAAVEGSAAWEALLAADDAATSQFQGIEQDLASLAAEAAKPKVKVNTLPNGSFEMGLLLWEALSGVPVITEGSVHDGSGKRALVLDSTGEKGPQTVRNTSLVPVRSDAQIVLSAWVSGFGITEGPGPEDKLMARLQFLDADSKTIAGGDIVLVLGAGLFDWTDKTTATPVPKAAVYVTVDLGLYGQAVGFATVDDVRLYSDSIDLAAAPYAAGAYPGGPALDLECTGCVGAKELEEHAAFPSGAIIMFAGACPAGWQRLSQFDGMLPRGAAQFGATGGSPTTSASGNHAHGVAGAGQHNHTIACDEFGAGWGGQFNGWTYTGANYCERSYYTYNAGDHSHPVYIDGNHTHGLFPPYFDVVFCKKD